MQLRTLSARDEEGFDLLSAALSLAADAYPGLDVAAQRRRLDDLAVPLIGLAMDRASARVQAAGLADHLFGTCGFRGNAEDYYDPENSYLNRVLDRRSGIPISLGLVYMEVAQRVAIGAVGVSFPGHFLVRIDDPVGESILVDPFNGGRVLARSDLDELAGKHGGRRVSAAMLARATPRQIFARMLMNLRAAYAARGDYRSLLMILDRLVEMSPDAAEELRDRGLVAAKLGAPGAALQDLARYLSLAPDARDADEVRGIVTRLSRTDARPN